MASSILPVTCNLRKTPLFRIDVEPIEGTDLKNRSQVMDDKVQSVISEKLGDVFGRLDDATMLSINRALAVWLGFA